MIGRQSTRRVTNRRAPGLFAHEAIGRIAVQSRKTGESAIPSKSSATSWHRACDLVFAAETARRKARCPDGYASPDQAPSFAQFVVETRFDSLRGRGYGGTGEACRGVGYCLRLGLVRRLRR